MLSNAPAKWTSSPMIFWCFRKALSPSRSPPDGGLPVMKGAQGESRPRSFASGWGAELARSQPE